MNVRYVDMFEPEGHYVSVNYWSGALNCWRVTAEHENGTRDLENVSDWRGLVHRNVPKAEMWTMLQVEARDLIAQGLADARREHRNYMARTRAARVDGAEDGRDAASWVEVVSAHNAASILRAMEELDDYEPDYPQTWAGNDEKWEAYTVAYDEAYAAEVARACAVHLAHDMTCGTCGRTWNEALTPTPASRCPWEHEHEDEEDKEEAYAWSPRSARWQAEHGERDSARTRSALSYLEERATRADEEEN